MSALAEIQKALFTRLDNDGPLAALGFSVYDEPPDSRSASYVVIGDSTETRGPGAHSYRAYEATETLHIWSRGNSTVRAAEALEVVRQAVEGTPLNVAGHGTMLVSYEFSMVMKEPNWRHIPVRFRIVTDSPLGV